MDKYLKQEIKNSFYDTISRVEKDLFLIEQNKIALKNTFVYKEEETIGLDSLEIYDGKVSVVDSNTTGAVEFENTAVLNFASATMIGGNPQSGSITQEAMLNRCTTLYPTLNSSQVKTEYYDYFKRINNDIYTDRMVISRNIYIIKDDQIVPNPFIRHEYLKIDVITSPAPNLSRKKLEKDEYIRIYDSDGEAIYDMSFNLRSDYHYGRYTYKVEHEDEYIKLLFINENNVLCQAYRFYYDDLDELAKIKEK